MAFSRTLDHIVQGVETLIVAPPGYGKRTFLLRNRHREPFHDFFDNEGVLRSPPNYWFGIITDCASLIPRAQLSFIFLPSKDVFISGCAAAGVEDPSSLYTTYLQYAKSATYVITSGDSLLFYQRFMEKAISHYFEGEPIVPVPVFKPGYKADPAYSDISIPIPQPSTSVEPDNPRSSTSSVSATPSSPDTEDYSESAISAVSSLDLDVEARNLSHSSPSSLLSVCNEYSSSQTRNVDLEELDREPDQLHRRASLLFTRKFNITMVPASVGFSTGEGNIKMEYFGGNFVKIGPIYMSLLVMFKKRFDNGTVQFSPPDWLVP